VRKDKGGRTKTINLWYDEKADFVWWGSAWDIYTKASEARDQNGTVNWYNYKGTWDPKFKWSYVDTLDKAPGASASGGRALQSEKKAPRGRGGAQAPKSATRA